MDFFFTLSGFVISHNYLDKIKNRIQFANFVKKRFYRLYPLHIMTLIVFIIIELIKLFAQLYTDFNVTYLAFDSHNNFFSLIANLFLVQGFYGWSYNLPSWSISTEFYTYLVFALIVYNYINPSRFFYLLFILPLLFLYNMNIDLAVFANIGRTLLGFFSGSIFYLIYLRNEKKINFILPLLFLILSLFFVSQSHQIANNYKYIIAIIFFSFTIYFTARLDSNSYYYKLITHKFLVYFGSISYGIYMIHSAIIWFFRQICRFILNIDQDINSNLIFSEYEGILITIFILILTITLSHLSLHYFENKFRINKN